MRLSPEYVKKLEAMGASYSEPAKIPGDPVAKANKFKAVKTTIDNITFDSKKEAARYVKLKLAEQCGTISGLELQPRFQIVINDIYIGRYTADFRYAKSDGEIVIEDVKSDATRKTEAYRLRKKIVEALHSITITEV